MMIEVMNVRLVDNLCKVPHCEAIASTTFAMVPLCKRCETKIWNETLRFYAKKAYIHEVEARPLYFEIDHLIPWSKTQIESKRREKANAVRGN
jgi:hypothetical protein